MAEELLTPEDLSAGFSLAEDDHLVTVLRDGEAVAYFSATGMTREALRYFLDKVGPGEGFGG